MEVVHPLLINVLQHDESLKAAHLFFAAQFPGQRRFTQLQSFQGYLSGVVAHFTDGMIFDTLDLGQWKCVEENALQLGGKLFQRPVFLQFCRIDILFDGAVDVIFDH